MKKLLRVNDLKFSYSDKKVLRGISLDFEKGKFYSIVGPNGCGKTTLIKNLSKMFSIEKNTVFLNDKDLKVFSTKETSKRISVVPQNLNINYEFSVYDVIMMGRVPHKKRFEGYNKQDEEIVNKAMKYTDTLRFKDSLVTELSGGELQRVVAARALAQETEVILLDEPTSHLDLQYQIEFLKIFKNICKDKVIIAVLHDLNLVSLFSDEIVMLKDGEIFKMGEAKSVMTKENIKAVYNIDVEILENEDSRYILPKI